MSFFQALVKAVKSKGDERPRRRRSLVDRLRQPNYIENRSTSRGIHRQQSICNSEQSIHNAARLVIEQEEEENLQDEEAEDYTANNALHRATAHLLHFSDDYNNNGHNRNDARNEEEEA